MLLYIAGMLVGVLVSCASAAVAMWAVRQSRVRELRGDVDEIAEIVAKQASEARRERMRRVRAGQADLPGLNGPSALPNPEVPAGASRDEIKAALRRRIRGIQ